MAHGRGEEVVDVSRPGYQINPSDIEIGLMDRVPVYKLVSCGSKIAAPN